MRTDYLNAQGQQRFVWPPSFPLALAYLDQLERSGGLPRDRVTAVRAGLESAERLNGASRRNALMRIATQLEGDASRSREAAKVRLLAATTRELAPR